MIRLVLLTVLSTLVLGGIVKRQSDITQIDIPTTLQPGDEIYVTGTYSNFTTMSQNNAIVLRQSNGGRIMKMLFIENQVEFWAYEEDNSVGKSGSSHTISQVPATRVNSTVTIRIVCGEEEFSFYWNGQKLDGTYPYYLNLTDTDQIELWNLVDETGIQFDSASKSSWTEVGEISMIAIPTTLQPGDIIYVTGTYSNLSTMSDNNAIVLRQSNRGRIMKMLFIGVQTVEFWAYEEDNSVGKSGSNHGLPVPSAEVGDEIMIQIVCGEEEFSFWWNRQKLPGTYPYYLDLADTDQIELWNLVDGTGIQFDSAIVTHPH